MIWIIVTIYKQYLYEIHCIVTLANGIAYNLVHFTFFVFPSQISLHKASQQNICYLTYGSTNSSTIHIIQRTSHFLLCEIKHSIHARGNLYIHILLTVYSTTMPHLWSCFCFRHIADPILYLHTFPSQTQCILSITTFICKLLEYIDIIASIQVSSHSLQSLHNKAPPSSMLISAFTTYTSTHFSHT